MPYKRGDVILVPFPDSNLQTAKRRPVLIVQRDNLGTGLRQYVVAMISSNMARTGHASRVSIYLSTPEGLQTGLQTDSVVMTDNLATLSEARIERVLGMWNDMQAIETALRHTLKL